MNKLIICICISFLAACSSTNKNKKSVETETSSKVSESLKDTRKSTADSLAEAKLKEAESKKEESSVKEESGFTKLDIDSGTTVILPKDLQKLFTGVNDTKGKRSLIVPKNTSTSTNKKEETKTRELEQKTQKLVEIQA
jgi:hypothetical protein